MCSDFREFYDLDETLGEGLQGVVRTVVHKQTGRKYAMKTVSLGQGKARQTVVYDDVLGCSWSVGGLCAAAVKGFLPLE